MPNPGYQGTWDFNPQMGQQVPRKSKSISWRVAAEGNQDDEELVQPEAKRADLFIQTSTSRVVWFGRSSYKLQAPRVCQVYWSKQYKHDRACQSVSYIIGWSISWGCPSSSFLLLIPVRASLHLVFVTTSQLHCQLGWPREEVSYIFLH